MKNFILSALVICLSTPTFAQINNKDICDDGKKAVQVTSNEKYHVKTTTTIRNSETTTKDSPQNIYKGEASIKGTTGALLEKYTGAELSGGAGIGIERKGEKTSTNNNKETTTVIEKYYKCEDDKQQSKSER